MDGDLAAGSPPGIMSTELLLARSPKPEGKSRSDEEEDAGAEPAEARFSCVFPSSKRFFRLPSRFKLYPDFKRVFTSH